MRYMVQYLEGSSDWSGVSPQEVEDVLLTAGSILPLSRVMVGWNLPIALLRACRVVCERLGAELYLWHPLLTGDGDWQPPEDGRVLGLDGRPVSAYAGMTEFAFLCPNQPEIREAILRHLDAVVTRFPYDGVFLDRMRFPSPTVSPFVEIGCCCAVCEARAAVSGLFLKEVRQELQERRTTALGCLQVVRDWMGQGQETQSHLAKFLNFRTQSITSFLSEVCQWLRSHKLRIGLDCFSPMLTRMVGQDLSALSAFADWVKIMTYGHVYAPAGIPGELLSLIRSVVAQTETLVETEQLTESDVLQVVSECTGIALPKTIACLEETGLASSALGQEARRGQTQISCETWAGLELVELPGITRLHKMQIQSDILAFSAALVDGLALSWDLWHIPTSSLRGVREAGLI